MHGLLHISYVHTETLLCGHIARMTLRFSFPPVKAVITVCVFSFFSEQEFIWQINYIETLREDEKKHAQAKNSKFVMFFQA